MLWFVVALLLATACILVINRLFVSSRRCFPSPPGAKPLLGHLLHLLKPDDNEKTLVRFATEHGQRCNLDLYVLGTRIVLLTQTETVLELLRTRRPFDFVASAKYNAACGSTGCGGNIVCAVGERHAQLRSKQEGAFSKTRLRQLEGGTRFYLAALGEQCDRGVLSGSDVDEAVTFYTLRMIVRVIFGQEFDVKQRALFEKMLLVGGKRATQLLQYWRLGFYVGQDKIDQVTVIEPLIAYVHNTIAEHRKDVPQSDKTRCLMSDLIDAGLNDAELQSAILLLLAGGFDTTKCSILWTLAYLASEPNLCARARQEVAADMDVRTGLPKCDSVFSGWPLIGAIYKEVLRLCPSLPVGGFTVIKDWQPTASDGVQIPGGTECLIPFRYINTREDSFTNATSFCPDRWMLPRDEARFPVHNSEAFVTFGGGVRVCLGRNLAEMEMKTVIAYLVYNFTWTLCDDHLPDSTYCFAYYPKPFGIKFTRQSV